MEVYHSTRTAAEMEYALGAVPSIGENGNWFIGEQDTGIFAKGINVTGAEVGQTVKITAVDENGVPTAWEPAEIVGGDKWRLISKVTTTEAVANFSISQDDNGNAFSLKKFFLTGRLIGADGAGQSWLLIETTSSRKNAKTRINCLPNGAPPAGGKKAIAVTGDLIGTRVWSVGTHGSDGSSENTVTGLASFDTYIGYENYHSYDDIHDLIVSNAGGGGFAADTIIELWGVDKE